MFVLFLKERANLNVDGRDELSSFYESSDFNSSGDIVSGQESSLGGISSNQGASDGSNEVKPVTDLEEQFVKDSVKDSILDKHSADVLADAVRSVMDEDS